MRAFSAIAICLLFTACVQSVAPVVVTSPDPRDAPAPATPAPALNAPPLSTAIPFAGASTDAVILAEHALAFPVAGLSIEGVRDSFDEARDGARAHRAVDILAPRGSPVLSADAGRILRLSTSTLGGITIYATDPGQRFVYYYAHLGAYRDGLSAGQHIMRGDTLGYVGTTGNAPKDTPHLHFQIMRMPSDPAQYWKGEPINPYPIFRELERRRQEQREQEPR
jgi:murein DD-endopeptidase MepM/ murein hydrolase activator NlpD